MHLKKFFNFRSSIIARVEVVYETTDLYLMLVELVVGIKVRLVSRVLVDKLECKQMTNVLDFLLVASDTGCELDHESLEFVKEGAAEVEQEWIDDGEAVDAYFIHVDG